MQEINERDEMKNNIRNKDKHHIDTLLILVKHIKHT